MQFQNANVHFQRSISLVAVAVARNSDEYVHFFDRHSLILYGFGYCDFLDNRRKSRMSASSMTAIARTPGVTCNPAIWIE